MNNQRDCEQGNLLVGVNEAVDPANLSNLEKKHIPSIKAPQTVKNGECFDVTLEVGKTIAHANESSHCIHSIDLHADETFLARTDFTAARTCPAGMLTSAGHCSSVLKDCSPNFRFYVCVTWHSIRRSQRRRSTCASSLKEVG